ncbi:hypothetical protein D3C87_1943190 [compost metagenome]
MIGEDRSVRVVIHQIVVAIDVNGDAAGGHHFERNSRRVGQADANAGRALIVQGVQLVEVANKAQLGRFKIEMKVLVGAEEEDIDVRSVLFQNSQGCEA